MADTQLVYALQNRQNGAMEQFQTAYTPLLRYIIAPILSDERDREECLSDVLLRVWDSIGTFDPGPVGGGGAAGPQGPGAVPAQILLLPAHRPDRSRIDPYTLPSELLASGFHVPSWQWQMYQWTSEGQLAPEGQYDPGKYWDRSYLPW